jgi:hypothetical protein
VTSEERISALHLSKNSMALRTICSHGGKVGSSRALVKARVEVKACGKSAI